MGLFKSGRLDDAGNFAKSLLSRYPREPLLYNILGSTAASRRNWVLAEKYFAKAVKLDPKNFEILRNLANVQRNVMRLLPAEQNLVKALKINPKFAEGWNSLALVYLNKGDRKKARGAFKRAFKIRPDFTEAASNYLIESERDNDIAQLEDTLKNFESVIPKHDVTVFCRGILHEKNKEYLPARKAMNTISFAPDSQNPVDDLEIMRVSKLAKINDRLGNYAEAYQQFTQSNGLLVSRTRPEDYKPETFHNSINSRYEYFKSDAAKNWPSIQTSDAAPVFIIGFPRSGTTLLDTFLRGHKDISVIEEQPLVAAFVTQLDTFSPENIPNLTTLLEDTARKSAVNYLKSLKKTAGSKPLIIDRMPFNLVHIGEILRVFPKAKFILAMRDPADTVFSCFMQVFNVEGAMSNMTTALAAAKTFDHLMQLWVLYLDKLDVDHIVCHYESLIEDAEATLKPVIDFLDLEWDPALLDHQRTAAKRDRINTASSSQVVQPIYKTAIKRWENYAEHMPEALDVIRPWRAHFGYE
ncbi:MAG: sulfotransferase [Alphaproteobacteria bacterium]